MASDWPGRIDGRCTIGGGLGPPGDHHFCHGLEVADERAGESRLLYVCDGAGGGGRVAGRRADDFSATVASPSSASEGPFDFGSADADFAELLESTLPIRPLRLREPPLSLRWLGLRPRPRVEPEPDLLERTLRPSVSSPESLLLRDRLSRLGPGSLVSWRDRMRSPSPPEGSSSDEDESPSDEDEDELELELDGAYRRRREDDGRRWARAGESLGVDGLWAELGRRSRRTVGECEVDGRGEGRSLTSSSVSLGG